MVREEKVFGTVGDVHLMAPCCDALLARDSVLKPAHDVMSQKNVFFSNLCRFTFASHFWIEIGTVFALELEHFNENSCSRTGETLIFRNVKCFHLREDTIERRTICGVNII